MVGVPKLLREGGGRSCDFAVPKTTLYVAPLSLGSIKVNRCSQCSCVKTIFGVSNRVLHILCDVKANRGGRDMKVRRDEGSLEEVGYRAESKVLFVFSGRLTTRLSLAGKFTSTRLSKLIGKL